MGKFEINNPEALKFIDDFKSGKFFQPYIVKIRKIKWLLISFIVLLVLLGFANFGKVLFRSSALPEYLPPVLETSTISTAPRQASEYDSLRDEIYNVSTDLPDPIMPSLDTNINLKVEQF